MPVRHYGSSRARPAWGFTLTEVLIVVAILALVVAVMVGISGVVEDRGKSALTENCMQLLNKALAEFHDLTGHYPVDEWGIDESGSRINGAISEPVGATPQPNELLYLQLSLIPSSRAIIENLPEQLVAPPLSGAAVQLAADLSSDTPYLRSIVDGWGNPLQYQRTSGFPLIVSYGPDGRSGGGDDITNGK